MKIFNIFKKLFLYQDLRKRSLTVILLLLFTRFLANIPLPDVDLEKFKTLFEANQFLGFINIFSGGALSNFSIALLGLGPYITASYYFTTFNFCLS
jgi:preprotein translocase subunit SecY